MGVGGLLLVAALGLMAGCGSGGSSGGGTTPVATLTVTGQVVSAADSTPVAGATVSTKLGTTMSAVDGSFTLPAPAGFARAEFLGYWAITSYKGGWG